VGSRSIDRAELRRVILGCLATIAVGLSETIFIEQLWQLVFL
jgi:hypothetical protein